jgi:hypothetical protein
MSLVGLGRNAEALVTLEKAEQRGGQFDAEDLTSKAKALRARRLAGNGTPLRLSTSPSVASVSLILQK